MNIDSRAASQESEKERRSLQAVITQCIQSVETKMDFKLDEPEELAWSKVIQPAQFGRRVILEPGQRVNPETVLRLNKLFCAESRIMNCAHEEIVRAILEEDASDTDSLDGSENEKGPHCEDTKSQSSQLAKEYMEGIESSNIQDLVVLSRGIHDKVREYVLDARSCHSNQDLQCFQINRSSCQTQQSGPQHR